MNLLQKGEDWLRRTRKAYAASPVTYARGPSTSATLSATWGFKSYLVTEAGGFEVAKESWDFLIDACDLELNGRAVTPKSGDRILVGELDDALAYEVTAIAGDRCWTWSGSNQATYRVHTKLVGRQPPQR